MKNIWEERKEIIFDLGFEDVLSTINLSDEKEGEFVKKIKDITTKFILKKKLNLWMRFIIEKLVLEAY